MRKFICLTLCIIFTLCLGFGVFANSSTGQKGAIIDSSELISNTDEAFISSYINDAYSNYGYAIVIVFTRDLSEDQRTREAFTEKYFEENGYGSHGIMLYVGSNSRTYDIYSAHKDGFSEISEEELDEIDDFVYSALRSNRFSEAALLFAQSSYKAISSGSTQKYYIGEKTDSKITEIIGVSLVIALIISLVTVFVMKSKMNGIKPQRGAHGYIDRSTVRIYDRRDRFLYSTVRKVRRDTDSHGGGGGGRTSSRSSGGSHRGGRF